MPRQTVLRINILPVLSRGRGYPTTTNKVSRKSYLARYCGVGGFVRHKFFEQIDTSVAIGLWNLAGEGAAFCGETRFHAKGSKESLAK